MNITTERPPTIWLLAAIGFFAMLCIAPALWWLPFVGASVIETMSKK